MCITLSFHWVSMRPAKGRGVCLGVFMSLSRGHAGNKHVSETCMRHALVPECMVIGQESLGQGWVQAFLGATLCGLGNCHFDCVKGS